jgi:cytochrome c oxidase subunit 2
MKKLFSLIMAVTLIFVLTACGSNAKDTAATANKISEPVSAEGITDTQAIVFKASAKTFKFDKDVYTVKAGTVKLTLENVDGTHGLSIEGTDVNLTGANLTKTTSLKAGTYNIKCSFPCGTGHMTMTAKLIVT